MATAAFNQSFDLNAIANAFPLDTTFKGRFPGLVFKLKKPKTTMLIFRTGKMVCTGARSEDIARRAVITVVKELNKRSIVIDGKPEIQVTNVVASANIGGFIDLEKLYINEIGKMRGKIIFEPGQFPALIYRWESPDVVFLIFSTGRIVCVGAKEEKEVYEAVEKLQRRLEESEVLIRS